MDEQPILTLFCLIILSYQYKNNVISISLLAERKLLRTKDFSSYLVEMARRFFFSCRLKTLRLVCQLPLYIQKPTNSISIFFKFYLLIIDNNFTFINN